MPKPDSPGHYGRRWLGLNPVIVASLADAALMSFRAVKKKLPQLAPGRTLAVNGVIARFHAGDIQGHVVLTP